MQGKTGDAARHLALKLQEVVFGRFESGHRGIVADTCMRAMSLVMIGLLGQHGGALVGMAVDKAVGPFAQRRADEALGLAVGLGFGEAVLELEDGAAGTEGLGPEAEPLSVRMAFGAMPSWT
jgi:hypothetical protein